MVRSDHRIYRSHPEKLGHGGRGAAALRLLHLDEDWSQSNDLAAQMPAKLAQLKDMFWIEAAKNDVLPIGGGLWVPDFHPSYG